jgi:protein TonB
MKNFFLVLILLILTLSKSYSQINNDQQKIVFGCIYDSYELNITQNGEILNSEGKQINKFIIKDKNILYILIDKNGKIFIENKNYSLRDSYGKSKFQNEILKFLDNGGGLSTSGELCDFCMGEKRVHSSDHPDKAVIKIQNLGSSKEKFNLVKTEIIDAYSELWKRISRIKYKKDFNNLICSDQKKLINRYYPIKIVYDYRTKIITKPKQDSYPEPEPITVVSDKTEIEETNFNPKTVEKIPENVSFMIVERIPTIPGCYGDNIKQKECFNDFIKNHFYSRFNSSMLNELGLSSGRKRIFVGFNINRKGELENINARAPHPDIKKEAIRIMNQLPKMKPGVHKDKVVIVRYSIPFTVDVK